MWYATGVRCGVSTRFHLYHQYNSPGYIYANQNQLNCAALWAGPVSCKYSRPRYGVDWLSFGKSFVMTKSAHSDKKKAMKRLIFALLLCFTATSLLVPGSQQANGSQEKVVTAAQVNGTWKSRGNIFNIWALGQQRLKVEFMGTYEYKTPSGPMANMGSGSGIARIEGDTAIFRPNDLELGPDTECKITMRFTKGKLIVEQEGACGFGLNVTAAGTYRRVSKAKPKFEEAAQARF